MRGKLTVVTGPMFAGKTTHLLHLAKSLPPRQIVIFKPSIDTRYSQNDCVSHNGDSIKARLIPIQQPDLLTAIRRGIKHIFVDELNFFTFDDLAEQFEALLNKGKNIYGFGLAYDFAKQPFGATLPLLALADEQVKLTAICDGCGGEAEHSYRKTPQHDQIVVGAKDIYGACCEECWPELTATL